MTTGLDVEELERKARVYESHCDIHGYFASAVLSLIARMKAAEARVIELEGVHHKCDHCGGTPHKLKCATWKVFVETCCAIACPHNKASHPDQAGD